jgi:hypothetical protein
LQDSRHRKSRCDPERGHDRSRVDDALSLGSVSESVLVVAENAVVQTEDAKVATTVSNRLIDELPLVVGGAMRSPSIC